MYLVRTPKLIKPFFKDLLWSVPDAGNAVFLTFDDGPIADVTPWVLDTLARSDARSTFFCIGRNVEREPEIFKRLKDEGHAIGNHTYEHCNGWN
nr:polysaccharide deacetylase family protein [Bacteroidota bacterium]